ELSPGELPMSPTRAHVAVFVDFASLSRAGVTEPAGTLAQALLRYAAGAGKVTLARGYADWGARANEAKDVSGARIAPVLVLGGAVAPASEPRAEDEDDEAPVPPPVARPAPPPPAPRPPPSYGRDDFSPRSPRPSHGSGGGGGYGGAGYGSRPRGFSAPSPL